VAKNLKLKAARAALDMTQKDLAEAISVSRQTMNAIEKGDYYPSVKLCIEAKELLSLAKLALGKDKESLAYEYVLSTFQGCSLDERNDGLQTLGVEHIGVRSRDK
jgi:putative transcriptional regulator